MDEIKIGDTIRLRALGANPAFDVKVEGIEVCDGDGHPAYSITDPETGEPDTVCSRDFVKVDIQVGERK